MLRIPWKAGPGRAAHGPVFISVTELALDRWRDLPRAYLAGLRLRRRWPGMQGAVGLWLWARPLARRAGSVSVWKSEEDLSRFLRSPVHVAIVRRYRRAGTVRSCAWRADRFDPTSAWRRAAHYLNGARPRSSGAEDDEHRPSGAVRRDLPDGASAVERGRSGAREPARRSTAGASRRVCVVGAGMSGLAAIRALRLAGHEVVCYEAGSAIGGMWRYCNDSGASAAYASLHTNTSKRRMQFPSLPMPDHVSEFPHHSEMLGYLERYARANDILRDVNFGARISAARPLDHGWEVTIAGGQSERYDALIVAGGHYWDQQIPQLPGHFEGELMHVGDYRKPEHLAGRRIVVVGAGQSALDIAAELTGTAASVLLACHQSHHLIPRRILGRPFDAYDSAAALLLPLPVVRWMLRGLMWAARSRPDGRGLPPARHRLFETRWPVVVSPQLEHALATKAFQSRPAVSALAGKRVIFADGSDAQADTILLATGYRINFPFLPGHLGRGHGWEFPLYRRILSPHAQGLAFIGILEPGPGLFEIVERQAAWLGEVLAGRLEVPTAERMWRAIDAGGEPRSRRQFAATGRHTILCNRHAYLRTLDRDLRATNPAMGRQWLLRRETARRLHAHCGSLPA
jgi:dimethylaniline monooxygenase (N-oxide forming)